jgi:hypothetical protein
MVKKEINEIKLPNFTADLSVHPTKHQYIEKVIVGHYDYDAIHVCNATLAGVIQIHVFRSVTQIRA